MHAVSHVSKICELIHQADRFKLPAEQQIIYVLRF